MKQLATFGASKKVCEIKRRIAERRIGEEMCLAKKCLFDL